MLYTASLRTNVELPLLRRSASFGGRIRRKFLDGEVERAAKAVGISPGQLGEPLAPPLILRAQLMRILLSHRPDAAAGKPFWSAKPGRRSPAAALFGSFCPRWELRVVYLAHFSEMSEICTHCYQLTDGPGSQCSPPHRKGGVWDDQTAILFISCCVDAVCVGADSARRRAAVFHSRHYPVASIGNSRYPVHRVGSGRARGRDRPVRWEPSFHWAAVCSSILV